MPADVVTILDVKCPGSGESHATGLGRTSSACAPHDEVKFVIKDRADYEYARDVIGEHALPARAAAIHLSPVHGELDPRRCRSGCWPTPAGARAAAAAQVHLGPDTRGV